jgi:hypothetical protein
MRTYESMNCDLVVKQCWACITDLFWEFLPLLSGSTVWDGGAQYTINFAKRKDFV